MLARLPTNLIDGLSSKQLPALDGVRAIAVSLVMFYHFGIPYVPGGLGVLAFFVLSGFLITWLLLAEEQKYNSISIRLFYIRRALRIMPAFYAYWILVIGSLTILHKPIEWPQACASLIYLSNYYQACFGDPGTQLSHTWSLGVEEQFYLLWPVTFVLLRRSAYQRARFLCAAICLVWIWRAVLQFGLGVNQGYIYAAFDTRADHLMVGCLLAVMLRAGLCAGIWHTLCTTPFLSVLTSAVLVASVTAENWYGSSYRNSLGFLINPILVAVLIPQLIAFRGSILWRWLEWRLVRYLGRVSYSTYLYQQIAPEFVRKCLGQESGDVPLAASVAVTIAAASLSFYLIERPLLRVKQSLTRDRMEESK